MLNPFIDLISNIIFLINLALTVWIVLTLLLQFDIINRSSPIVNNVLHTLNRLLDPMLNPIRNTIGKYLPNVGFDLSPIILWLILRFIRSAIFNWFYIAPLMTTTVAS